VWTQESITGSVFEARFQRSVAVDAPGRDSVLPEITGTAHVTGEGTLLLDARDPLRWGIGAREGERAQ